VGVGAVARELVFRSADGGFERSLTLDDARDADALLAYGMNGAPLPARHGGPVRLVVPGWYAMASVKWLTHVEAITSAFRGPYQTDKYVYRWPDEDGRGPEPVTLQRVRALVTEPRPGDVVRPGELTVRGVAWSGAAPIARVEVSVGGGTWQPARLVGRRQRHSWQWWELITPVETPGPTTIRPRATDLAGRTQPEQAEWNELGYGNNAIQSISLSVESRSDELTWSSA
jgi:DMSO/TMAO reductase YedYZ molybdopterin-dependent catalytic subunit